MKTSTLWIPLLLAVTIPTFVGGCQKKVDLTATETSGVVATTPAQTQSETTETTLQETTSVESTTSKTIEASSKSYQKEKVQISYPEIAGIKDENLSKKINEKIHDNVTSVIEAMGLDPSTTQMDIKEELIGSGDKRITIAYTGTMSLADGSEKKVFFTNTIDAKTGKDLGLSDFVDPQTMAGYVLSNDVKLHNASPEIAEKFMDYRHKTTYEDYVDMLTTADFPLQRDAEGKIITFPKSFSYVKNGDIYFSLPVSKELGDYVIIVYSTESK